MKQIIFLMMSLFTGVFAMATPVHYWAQFNVNNMDCKFYLNDMPFYDTRRFDAPYLITFGHEISEYISEGENIFKLYGFSIPKERVRDDMGEGKAYCEMTISAMVMNPQTNQYESKEVTMLRMTIDEAGQFTSKESTLYPEPSLTTAPKFTQLNERIESESFIDDAVMTRSLTVNHPHRYFRWVTAKPFIDTPNNREHLWETYEAWRNAFAQKDLAAIVKLWTFAGMEDLARYRGLNTPEEIKGQAERYIESIDIPDHLNNSEFKMKPIKPETYELKLYAGGRLFRFVAKNSEFDSPIEYRLNTTPGYSINPIFTIVDGKIAVAF